MMSPPCVERPATIRSPVWFSDEEISSLLAPSDCVTRTPASLTVSASDCDVAASVCDRFSCAPVMAPRTFSALTTIASRSLASSSISERMRRSLSE